MKLLTVTGLAMALALFNTGCSSEPKTQPHPMPETKSSATTAEEPASWFKIEKISPIDGTKEIVLTASSTDHPGSDLIVRFIGKKLEVYANTDEVVDNQSAAVRIKFDDGTPVRQTWTRSTDYKAVFSPDPFGLITKLQRSSKFYLEYHPYARVPETITFDVARLSEALPSSEMAFLQKKVDDFNASTAALRAIVLPHVHLCVDQLAYPGEWCYTGDEPEFTNDSTPFPTKEEAIKSAIESARAGVAFRNHALSRTN